MTAPTTRAGKVRTDHKTLGAMVVAEVYKSLARAHKGTVMAYFDPFRTVPHFSLPKT
jgi:hypothetical protein